MRRALRHAFLADSVARAYACRPPYPDSVYARLDRLLGEGPRRVLDAGCGPGKLARGLAPGVERVDAVDPSAAMLAAGRVSAGGDHPAIRWICAPIEDAPLDGPYGLVVAGASVHWFDLDRALPRLAASLSPGACFAMVDGDGAWSAPWEDAELELFMALAERRTGKRPSLERTADAPRVILDHPCFERIAHADVEVRGYAQSVDDYVECQHSRAGLARETLGPELTTVFARKLRALLSPYAPDGTLRYDLRFRMEWGTLRV